MYYVYMLFIDRQQIGKCGKMGKGIKTGRGFSGMTKLEFEALVGREISVEDYQVIDVVYMYYPDRLITEKSLLADLYKACGMRVFRDLYPRAREICELDAQIRALQVQLQGLRETT